MNILFTCAGRRNYLINYFKQAIADTGSIFAADMQLAAPALVDADYAIKVPSFYDPDYLQVLIEKIQQHQIDAIISLNDLELPVLCKSRKLIESKGAKLLISNEAVINICFDKWRTFQFIQSIGLHSPLSFIDYDQALAAIYQGRLTFPLVLKPRWGSASIGIEYPETLEELKLAYQLLKLRLQRSILAQASQHNIDQAILIQQKINGDEYGMDVLNDFENNYKGCFVRQKLSMRSGETDKAVSVIDPRFEAIGRVVGTELKHLGNLDCDLLQQDGQLYLLELNPRFGGGYPFSHEAGMNSCRSYLSWMGNTDSFQTDNQYQAGIEFSKCDRLLQINSSIRQG